MTADGVIRPVPNVRVGDVIDWAGHRVVVIGIAERSNGRRFQITGDVSGLPGWVHYFNDETVRAYDEAAPC